jgi:hypothetical protein
MIAGRKEGRGRHGRVYRYLFLASLAGEGVVGGGVVTRVEGEDKVKGDGMHPYPQQARPKIPSSLNVPKKVAIATLCTLWIGIYYHKIKYKSEMPSLHVQ